MSPIPGSKHATRIVFLCRHRSLTETVSFLTFQTHRGDQCALSFCLSLPLSCSFKLLVSLCRLIKFNNDTNLWSNFEHARPFILKDWPESEHFHLSPPGGGKRQIFEKIEKDSTRDDDFIDLISDQGSKAMEIIKYEHASIGYIAPKAILKAVKKSLYSVKASEQRTTDYYIKRKIQSILYETYYAV